MGEIEEAAGRLTFDEVVAFANWLRRSGVHVASRNRVAEHVLRYMAWKGRVGLVLLDDGKLRANRVASHHFLQFQLGADKLERPLAAGVNLMARRKRLMERDGSDCCICGRALGADISLEHWVALTHDGTEDDANLGLAHKVCNYIVDSLSVSEKLRVRDVLADWLERHVPHHCPFDPSMLPTRGAIQAWAGITSKTWFNSMEEEIDGEVQCQGMPQAGDASPAGAREV